MQTFVEEKRALGCKYEKEAQIFREMDRVMVEYGVVSPELPRYAVEKWIEKRPNEKRKNQKYRLNFTKRFVSYLQSKGYRAYYPNYSISTRDDSNFTPYIFSNEELSKILNYLGNLTPSRQYPQGHIIWPLLFKTLICCGLRAGEAANLRVKDVDLVNGILLITESKHDKTRQVPVSENLWAEYVIYAQKIHLLSRGENFFFPNARGNAHNISWIYKVFRDALWHSGIPHRGRGYGPRVHDFRYPNLNKIQTFQKKDVNRNKYRLKKFGYYFYLFLLIPQKSTREPSGFFHFADTFLSFSSSRVASAFAFSSTVISR